MKIIDNTNKKKLEDLGLGDVIRYTDPVSGYMFHAVVANNDVGDFFLLPLETGNTADTSVGTCDTFQELLDSIRNNYPNAVEVDAELHIKGVIDEQNC